MNNSLHTLATEKLGVYFFFCVSADTRVFNEDGTHRFNVSGTFLRVADNKTLTDSVSGETRLNGHVSSLKFLGLREIRPHKDMSS